MAEPQKQGKSRTSGRSIVQPTSTMRWLSILMRTGHIGVAALFFGGSFFLVPFPQLAPWHHLTIATGIGLLVLELRHDWHWPFQGKGLLGLVHIVLGLLIHLRPTWTIPLLCAILVSGCIGSHMSRRFRHWSILRGWEVRDGVDKPQ